MSFWRQRIERRIDCIEHTLENQSLTMLQKAGISAFRASTFDRRQYAVHAYEVEAYLKMLTELYPDMKLPKLYGGLMSSVSAQKLDTP